MFFFLSLDSPSNNLFYLYGVLMFFKTLYIILQENTVNIYMKHVKK